MVGLLSGWLLGSAQTLLIASIRGACHARNLSWIVSNCTLDLDVPDGRVGGAARRVGEPQTQAVRQDAPRATRGAPRRRKRQRGATQLHVEALEASRAFGPTAP